MKYSEIVQKNRELGLQLKNPTYPISILGNITTQSLKAPLEFALRSRGINAVVESGDFDNIVQNSLEQSEARAVILFWELINFEHHFPDLIRNFDASQLEQFIQTSKLKIDFVLANLAHVPIVLFTSFSAQSMRIDPNYPRIQQIADRLNEHVASRALKNLIFIDSNEILGNVTLEKSFNLRDYEVFSSLYTFDFYREYVSVVAPILLGMNGHIKKVLVVDCDGTLWNGIIGEDGINNIEVGLSSETGRIFYDVQQSILKLKKKGILIGICSKNNPADVKEVFEKHPGMILRSNDIDIKKVNWNDKASNLRAMALELNLGLDSFVFLDDSSYEVDFIKKNIPEVLALKVPQALSEYPRIMKQIEYLFWSPKVTDEDKSRSSMMQAEQLRSTEKKKFHSVADYLKDLDLKLKIEINPTQWISRLSQLTMKTNQFNTTTLRITEAELEEIYSRSDCRVYAFDARDKYGDYGITGLSIAELQNNEATLKVFLMSCRTIGRDFERAFFNFIASDLRSLGIETLHCPYHRTQKNNLVENLYDKLGCKLSSANDSTRNYVLDLATHSPKPLEHVSILGAPEMGL